MLISTHALPLSLSLFLSLSLSLSLAFGLEPCPIPDFGQERSGEQISRIV